MKADDFDVLAGRIEGLARLVMHLAARLEDDGHIDGPALAEGLRHSIALRPGAGNMMKIAQRTLNNAADTLDDARRWRRFREQLLSPAKRSTTKRRAT